MKGRNDIVGLEADARTIHLVRLRRRGPAIRWIDALQLERSGDPHTDVQRLRRLLKEKEWTGLACVLGIRSGLVSTRILEVSGRETGGIRQLVADQVEAFEALTDAPTRTAHAVYRYRGQRHLLLVMARQDTVLEELRLPQEAGLQVVEVLPDSVALARGIRALCPGRREPFIGLALRGDGTDGVIGDGNALLHLWRSPVGGALLEQEQAQPAELPAAERPLFRQWLGDLQTALRAYRNQYDASGFQPARLVLTGAHRLSPEHQAALTAATGLTPTPPRHADQPAPGGYATALGAALTVLRRRGPVASLLPHSMKNRAADRELLLWWLLACGALLAALWVSIVHAQRELDWTAFQLLESEARLLELTRQDAEWNYYQARNERLREKLTPLHNAYWNNRAVRVLLAEADAARHPDDWFVLIADAGSYFQPLRADALQGPRPLEAREPDDHLFARPMTRFILEGFTPATDLSTVRSMIENLRWNDFIARVDLLPDDKIRTEQHVDTDWMDSGVRRFAIELHWAGGEP
jgi:hypothetical protein